MMILIPLEGVTETELEIYLASLPRNAQKDVRHLLASGAAEAEIADYIASLEAEPEDLIGQPEGEPTIRPPGFQSSALSGPQATSAVQKRPRGGAKGSGSPPGTAADRVPKRRGKLMAEGYNGPRGVQGANKGYWQSSGVTRVGAKRSKRP
jgi:hypothetical protein